jgi:hypothetical protein
LFALEVALLQGQPAHEAVDAAGTGDAKIASTPSQRSCRRPLATAGGPRVRQGFAAAQGAPATTAGPYLWRPVERRPANVHRPNLWTAREDALPDDELDETERRADEAVRGPPHPRPRRRGLRATAGCRLRWQQIAAQACRASGGW